MKLTASSSSSCSPPETKQCKRRSKRAKLSDKARSDRANWTEENTLAFCEIWCDQIEKRNCGNGNMSKQGWKEVFQNYYEATNLVLDRVKINHKLRQLRSYWGFIQTLRNNSGLGRNPDGTISATDQWWKEHTEGHPDWMKLKYGWPLYMDEMDRMFLGKAADGSTSYVPGATTPINVDDDEEAAEDDAEDEKFMSTGRSTPSKAGTKRSSSVSTTAESPNKRRSSAATSLDNGMHKLGSAQNERNQILNNHLALVRNAKTEKIRLVQQLSREVGATEQQKKLWRGVHKITKDEGDMDFFIGSTPEGRKDMIECFAEEPLEPRPPSGITANEELLASAGIDKDLLLLLDDTDEMDALHGKFYLMDSGYPNRPGYLAPYKGTKYHIPEFRDGPEPQGKHEIFNYVHSSLRNVFERSFGVLKKKWRMLEKIPSYPTRKQSKIITAACALHNYIRMSGLVDDDFANSETTDIDVESEASTSMPSVSQVRRDASAAMNQFRDSVADGLMSAC